MPVIDTFCTDTCHVSRRTGTSQHGGKGSFGTPVPRACRYQDVIATITAPSGDEIVSEAQVFLRPGTPIENGDQVTYQGRSWEAKLVARKRALDFEDHVFVYLGPFRK